MVMENDGHPSNHTPCQPWPAWSTTSNQGSLFTPLPSSQHLCLGSSTGQRPSYNHPQASNHSCMIDTSGLSSSHHSGLYRASHSGGNSLSLFANTAIPESSSHSVSFVQQSPHTSSMLLTPNQGKNRPAPSLHQANQVPQPCGPQQPPFLSIHNPLEMSFQPPLTNHVLPSGLQDLPISLPPCGQHSVQSTSQGTTEGKNVEFAGVSGNTQSHSLSPSQKQHQWIPSPQCRGRSNKPVPAAAAHLDKEPPQQQSVSPLDSGETQRSVLLHQRAQLLQQLAELDKHLESVSPDDSGDGPTAVQSETCDGPEDELSEAESMTKENLSDDSEDDGDLQYFPKSCSDSSDGPFEPDGGSSDESCDGIPSTPTGESPSSPEKSGDASEMSLSQAEKVHLPKQTQEMNLHLKKSAVTVLPKLQFYDRRNYCLFCSKPVSKMSRHLERIHSDKPEVAAAFQYPLKSKERLKIWHRLINQGNFAHNKDVLKKGKGQLVVRQRPSSAAQAVDFLHCLYCRGLFKKKGMYQHMRTCPERVNKESHVGKRRIASQCVLEASDDLGISDGLKSVLCEMTYNDVTQTIMDDRVLLQYGEHLLTQYGADAMKHHYIRQNIRHIARLVFEAQKITPLRELEDFFLPSNFDHVISAVKVVAGYNPQTKRYAIPSYAFKIGYHLQKACTVVESNAVNSGDARLAESARHFLSVYQKKWNKLVSEGALTEIKEMKMNRARNVPAAQDVRRLTFHAENAHEVAEKNLRENTCLENYTALVHAILTRTLLLNRRSVTEISSLKLSDFAARKTPDSHATMDVYVSDLERTLCRFFPRIDIKGQNGRIVPVILKPSFVSSIELFVQAREKCGISSENPFLFARPNALSSYRAGESVQRFIKRCGAELPELLTVAMIRKHYAEMLQMLSLDESEADQILGPNNQVRTLRQSSSVELEAHEDVDVERLRPRRNQRASWTDDKEHATVSPKKGTQNSGKHKWEEAEVEAVERHMMDFITGHKVPQKNDCIQCLEAEPEALRDRSWKGVKNFVRNRITTLKKNAKVSKVRTPRKSRKTSQPDKDEADRSPAPPIDLTEEHSSSSQLDDGRVESDERSQTTGGQQAADWGHDEHLVGSSGPDGIHRLRTRGATAATNATAAPKAVKSGKKSSDIQNSGKHRWEEAEVEAVERHLMHFIKRHKVPQKDDCDLCLEAEPEALRNRSWKGVKNFVRNRITTLRRQSGNSGSSSTKSNQRREEEQQLYFQTFY